MAEYQEITDTEVQPEAPLTSSLGVRFRDNPIALAQGAAGAPRIRTAALQPPEAGQGFLIRRIQDQEDGTTENSYPPPSQHDRFSERQHLGVTVLVPGVITCYMQHKLLLGASGALSIVRVLKNGSQVQQWSTSSTSFQTRTVNISVEIGDSVIFQNRRNDTSDGSRWRFLRVYSNNPDMAVA